KALEEERVPRFAVEPIVGQGSVYEKTELTAWADLAIKNTSTCVTLLDVSVKIVQSLLVCQGTDEVPKGTYRLFKYDPEWSPYGVYWSGRTDIPRQFGRPIHPGEAEFATIAFHHQDSGALAVFNTLAQTTMFESKITIEVSSPNSNTWKGDFYIAYQPKGMGDKFEFVDWESWCNNHAAIEQSTPDKGDSQT
ncbi:MAG: hypothetical protein Q7T05_07930, partial [Dehalococcoidia bacterium]|nr:hypothetical protein [Dehalococcoidia bacterium]